MKAYAEDLAYIHDVGFGQFARESAPGVLQMLQKHGITSGTVVDLGCGSGIWAAELEKANYDVVGVDISPAMLAIARARGAGGEFHAQSYLKFRFPPCVAVTALGEVFNYLFDKRNDLCALEKIWQRIHTALPQGGLLIFDVAEPGRARGRPCSMREGEDWAVFVRNENNRQQKQLTRHVVSFRQLGKLYRRSNEVHTLQLYEGKMLAQRLRAIGFSVRLLRSYGRYRLPESIIGIMARKK